MYNDLADAIEDLKEKGLRNLSEELEPATDQLQKKLSEMKIVTSYRFDSGTDPGDESTLYILEMKDKSQGFLVLGFGTNKDPDKSDLIHTLKQLEQKQQLR